jgi:hypothetical protein
MLPLHQSCDAQSDRRSGRASPAAHLFTAPPPCTGSSLGHLCGQRKTHRELPGGMRRRPRAQEDEGQPPLATL